MSLRMYACYCCSAAVVLLWTGCGGAYRTTRSAPHYTVDYGEALGRISAEAPRRFTFSDHEIISSNVREGLSRFGDAVQNLPYDLRGLRHSLSSSGKAVAVYRYLVDGMWHLATPPPPTGVWIWPDWRDGDSFIHIEAYSNAEFLSNRHVKLRHGMNTVIIEYTAPERRFNWWPELAKLRVADNGRWAGLTRDGRVFVGQLEREDSLENGEAVKLGESPKDLLLLRDGDVLVVETDAECIRTITFSTGGQVDSMRGLILGVGWDDTFLVIRRNEPGLVYVSVSSEGELEAHPMRYLRRERAHSPSPSGRFFLTYRDGWAPGMIHTRIRRTPKADRSQPLPALPRGVRSLDWLSWD